LSAHDDEWEGMMAHEPGEITRVLQRLSCGDAGAEAELFELLSGELRKLAAAHMRRERGDHTLSPTALVHEVYIRLSGHFTDEWKGKAHFMSIAARSMRRVLVDHARANQATKRGGDAIQVDVDDLPVLSFGVDLRLLALDEALTKLSSMDSRKARLVELRYFAGQTETEAANILGVTRRTVNRDWEFAKAWLYRELEGKTV
jgi:RNA polymerase sigma-70 factor, ECF subfamily